MTYADLGPPIPAEAMDLPPFRIETWAIISDTNGLGEAVMTVAGRYAIPGNVLPVVLVISAHPRSGDLIRAAALKAEGDADVMRYVPGNVADLVRTKVLEVFGPAT